MADSELKGERPVWPIWWQSPIWVMPADLPIKLDPVVLAVFVAKPGKGGFADLGLKGNRPVCRKIGDHRRVFRFTGNR